MTDVAGGVRGAVVFLTRLPIESDESDWRRFQTFPAAFPLAGYLVGALLAIPFILFDAAPTAAAAAYLVFVYLLTGVNHLDGVADLGDAAAIHDAERRRKALKDTTTGVGAVGAVAVVVAALALAAVALAGLPLALAVVLVVASEVSAKLAMATVACFGTATHEGLGSGFTRNADPALLVGPLVAAVPAALLGVVVAPSALLATIAAVAVGPLVGYALVRWATRAIGGVNGDVFGAANELARLVALHLGVVVWMRF